MTPSGPGRTGTRLALEGLGTCLLAAATVMEVTDRSQAWELALALASAVCYLLLTPLVAPRQRMWLIVAIAFALMLTVAGTVRVAQQPSLNVLHVLPLLLVAYALFAVRSSARRETRLRRERVRARHDGEERERRRWARELHDDTLQELGAVQVVLSTAAADGRPEAMREAIDQARGLVGNQIVSLRHLIVDLRPVVLDELGLQPALQALCRRSFETYGIRTELRLGPQADTVCGRLTAETQAQMYRIVQEAITNAVKHAEPTRVVVNLESDQRYVHVAITDNGHGMAAATAAGRAAPRAAAPPSPQTRGIGMSAMRERAELVDARLTVRSAPGEGTTVDLRVPWGPGEPPCELRGEVAGGG
ncbi:sensor histidine kinase [Actinacidiphila glaucinigra]|uniref:sensor histidine kinase n=1 Tax=Actinacidiphila glaucinigra TaxID=235986 RepID=UPI0037AB0F5B